MNIYLFCLQIRDIDKVWVFLFRDKPENSDWRVNEFIDACVRKIGNTMDKKA